ncbi:MAG: isoprenylcysteine carboxylmethyltransferase family protein [Nitrospiria bacterium]
MRGDERTAAAGPPRGMTEAVRGLIRDHRITISFLLSLLVLMTAHPTVRSIVGGLPLVLLGEALRTWASGYLRKDDELTVSGPYAYSRNPLYLGSFILGLGFSVMTGWWWMVAVFAAVFLFMYRTTIRREEDTLAAKFGARFEGYRAAVPWLFPRWPAPPLDGAPRQTFEWRLVKKHREFNTWLGLLGAVLLMVGIMNLRGTWGV